MSAEEASSQAPPPKAAASFSSFINKNTTGKKFAPKAARRRPGAAPAAPAPTPTSTPSAAETPTPAPESQTPQAEPEPSNAPPAVPLTAVQLPTPAATQEPAQEPVQEPSIAPAVTSTAPEPSPTPAEPLPTPTPNAQGQTQTEQDTQTPQEQGLTADYLEDDVQHIPARSSAATTGGDTGHEAVPAQQLEQSVTTIEQAPVADPSEQTSEATSTQPTTEEQLPSQLPTKRKLPWVAVNQPQDGGEAPAAAPTRKPRAPPKPRGRKKAVADADPEHIEQDEEGEEAAEEEASRPRKRPTAKTLGKRKAAGPATQEGEETAPQPKKPRKPRKAKPNLSNETVEGTEDEVGRIADEIIQAATRRKPRKPKQRRNATPEGEHADGVDGEEDRPKKKRGRPAREDTPSDAEDRTIDPEVTYMDTLASRHVRFGKLSQREKQMRTIDWDAVKQRRREEDNRQIASKAEQEAADRALAEAGAERAAQADSGTQLRMNADGVFEIVANSGVIDREAEADRAIAQYETVEDQDITARLTTRSFMKNNKRFPNEFILPGQGRRWNNELTERFYDALRSFGTDFQMISSMFPGFPRRAIKTKFTREERDNPEGVREALQSRCLMDDQWGKFLEHSNQTDESFANVDEIKRQMAEKEAEFRERINAAAAEAEERREQRKLAGLDDENGDGKENGKGKKKRGKGKQVQFQEEQGVEIVGEVGEDDTWGQE